MSTEFKSIFEELCLGKNLQDDFILICDNR